MIGIYTTPTLFILQYFSVRIKDFSSEIWYNNDWLFIGNDGYQWTMTPHSSCSYVVFDVNSSGYVGYRGTSDHTNRVFSPATYLSSNVKIVGGDGSKSFPFILSL